MNWPQTIRILNDCEQSLRKLVAEAANAGDYTGVQRLADLAKAVAALAAEGASVPAAVAAKGNVHAETKAKDAGKRRPAGDYPRFFRRGDELVKVGWSKKERREYSHRAPRSVLAATAAAVRQAGARGRHFTGDALLPLTDADGATLPPYQAYVALAWMKHLGLVRQIGTRGGYTLAPDQPLDAALTAAWPGLEEWPG